METIKFKTIYVLSYVFFYSFLYTFLFLSFSFYFSFPLSFLAFSDFVIHLFPVAFFLTRLSFSPFVFTSSVLLFHILNFLGFCFMLFLFSFHVPVPSLLFFSNYSLSLNLLVLLCYIIHICLLFYLLAVTLFFPVSLLALQPRDSSPPHRQTDRQTDR